MSQLEVGMKKKEVVEVQYSRAGHAGQTLEREASE